MKTKWVLLLSVALVMLFSVTNYAQKTFFSFDGTASKWTIGKAEATNVVLLTDDFENQSEGTGCLKFHVEIKKQPAGWGTWTDEGYVATTPFNIKGATDIRFKIKMVKAPAHNRSLQFTFDMFDSTAGAATLEGPWRWMEDLDIFYNPALADKKWHEVVIPVSRLAIPSWATSVNGKVDLDGIKEIHFGVHSDSSGIATDTVEFLVDDLRFGSSKKIGSVLSCDEPASKWVIGTADPANKVLITNDNEEYTEGIGSYKVEVRLVKFPASWGTWSDIHWDFAKPVDITGATELRFMMKIKKGAKRGLMIRGQKASSNFQMTVDLFDSSAGGSELYRWFPSGGGVYGNLLEGNRIAGKWNEIAIPLADFGQPSWATPINNKLDQNLIKALAFGVHGDDSLCTPDTVIFYLDNFYATAGQTVTGVERDGNLAPGEFTFRLQENYPNPFNPTTTIRFELPESGNVNLKIFDIQGREVYTVIDNAFKIKGSYEYRVDLNKLSSGVYMYTLQQNNNVITKKMTLLK